MWIFLYPCADKTTFFVAAAPVYILPPVLLQILYASTFENGSFSTVSRSIFLSRPVSSVFSRSSSVLRSLTSYSGLPTINVSLLPELSIVSKRKSLAHSILMQLCRSAILIFFSSYSKSNGTLISSSSGARYTVSYSSISDRTGEITAW